jgi:hypothetical protein
MVVPLKLAGAKIQEPGEVSWITGGERYTGVHTDLRQALANCSRRFLDRAGLTT